MQSVARQRVAKRKISARILRNRFTIPYTPFYKRYPFQSKASIQSADARGCVDFELGFFCNRIPKAANSTVVSSLATLKMGREVGSKEAKRLFSNPSELTPATLEQFQSLYKFLFVRNPYSRTLSAYLDKVHRKKQGTRGLEAIEKVDQNAARRNFLDFLKKLQNGSLFSNAHWAPQTSILLIPYSEFDFTGRVETLDEDLGQVLQRFSGCSLSTNETVVERERAEENSSSVEKINPIFSNATGAGSKQAFYYEEESIEIVKQLYHKDFETFRYSTAFYE